MARTLDKCGALSEDITALAELPSSSQQNEQCQLLKPEVAAGTLQIEIDYSQTVSSFLTSSPNETSVLVSFWFRELC